MGKGRKVGVNHSTYGKQEDVPDGPGGPCSNAEGAPGVRESTSQRSFETRGKNVDRRENGETVSMKD